MAELIFQGRVSAGIGCHATLFVPGRGALPNAPIDWPDVLYPGSLNVHINTYPPELHEHGLPNDVAGLDSGLFIPEFEIIHDQFGNNKLCPGPNAPRRGDAQVWRAAISSKAIAVMVECWTLRRFGSQVGQQLEFVAGRRLRDLGLKDDLSVTITLVGNWRNI